VLDRAGRRISLDPARNDVRVEWLALEELAVEVDRIGIQPDPEDSPAAYLTLLPLFGIGLVTVLAMPAVLRRRRTQHTAAERPPLTRR